MAGSWTEVAEKSGAHYAQYRRDIAAFISSISVDTVVFSHFIAINAVIGAATDDDRVVVAHLDNCSVTIFEVDDGKLSLTELGGEADTLIR
jgi:broad specificity phosphatase PhoE